MPKVSLFIAAALIAPALTAPAASRQTGDAPTAELDRFMEQVLVRRDDNWRKVQQYILEERERVQFRGPAEAVLWGHARAYVWYPRDGYFVRSPVRVNGVTVGQAERERYEARSLERAKRRDAREPDGASPDHPPAQTAPSVSEMQAVLQQSREPGFISSAYFLKFKFESGRYALVSRETISGVPVLRIEYYPTKLFSDEPSTRAEARTGQVGGRKPEADAYNEAVQQMMNKVSLVTLWVEPESKQIIKYTFDNIGLDFLPAAWLVRVSDVRANMLMTQAFPGVWLPMRIDMLASILLAGGSFSLTYDIQYSGFREAVTGTRYLGPKDAGRER